MKKSSEQIIFFGSGPVAAKSLEALYESFSIRAVVTKPVPPHHHEEAPVEKLAREKRLNTYFVRDRKELDELFHDQNILINVRLGVLIDFGIIVTQAVINQFELGIVNSHFSLLPQWRGADPITFSILSGQQETGVSLMVINEAMDEGPLIARKAYKLSPDITTPKLTDELVRLSNSMLASFLPAYIAGSLQPRPQSATLVPTYSRKLTKQDGHLDWQKDAEELEREIRSFIDWPKSYTIINNMRVIITKAHVEDIPGEAGVIEIRNEQLIVHCLRSSLIIDMLKPSGKKEMSSSEFLRGYPFK